MAQTYKVVPLPSGNYELTSTENGKSCGLFGTISKGCTLVKKMIFDDKITLEHSQELLDIIVKLPIPLFTQIPNVSIYDFLEGRQKVWSMICKLVNEIDYLIWIQDQFSEKQERLFLWINEAKNIGDTSFAFIFLIQDINKIQSWRDTTRINSRTEANLMIDTFLSKNMITAKEAKKVKLEIEKSSLPKVFVVNHSVN